LKHERPIILLLIGEVIKNTITLDSNDFKRGCQGRGVKLSRCPAAVKGTNAAVKGTKTQIVSHCHEQYHDGKVGK
jgi:hypothetical protein